MKNGNLIRQVRMDVWMGEKLFMWEKSLKENVLILKLLSNIMLKNIASVQLKIIIVILAMLTMILISVLWIHSLMMESTIFLSQRIVEDIITKVMVIEGILKLFVREVLNIKLREWVVRVQLVILGQFLDFFTEFLLLLELIFMYL